MQKGGPIKVSQQMRQASLAENPDESKRLKKEHDQLLKKAQEVEELLEKLRNNKADLAVKIEHYDDHQSPVTPLSYQKMRLKPALKEYRQKIPSVAFHKMLWQVILFVCTVFSALLSYASLAPYVAIVSAMATAITSWIAFEDLENRLVRYTNTVRALETLMSWWDSLGEYGAATESNINKLFVDGEAIITSERTTFNTGISKGRLAASEDKHEDRLGHASIDYAGANARRSGGGG